MHNQKRDEYKARLRDEVIGAKLAKKASQWHALSAELIRRRKQFKKDEMQEEKQSGENETLNNNKTILETLKLTDKVLTVNPDPVYLWNHRRELLLKLLDTKSIESNPFIQQEQILTQAALQRNPKAYGAWFHRKWSIRQFIIMTAQAAEGQVEGAESESKVSEMTMACRKVLEGELILCSDFLTLDERNFHCWNYRRFVVSTLAFTLSNGRMRNMEAKIDGAWNFLHMEDCLEDIPIIGSQLAVSSASASSSVENHDTDVEQVHELLKKEWDFTSEKIYQNFSNGSAFHYRSKLMPMLLHYDLSSSSEKTRSDWVQEELELIRNAIFTEPDDQTSWWYFRFVLAWANPMTYQKDGEDEGLTSEEGKRLIGEYMGILFEEWTSIQELVEAEDGKCKWGLLGMYMIATTFNELAVNGIQEAISYEGEDWLELAQSYLRELKELDPDRKHRYESMER